MGLGPTLGEKIRARLRGLPRPREIEPSLSLLGDLRRIGWHESFSTGPEIAHEPVPWLTYPAIYWLHTIKHELRAVFEYGCGNSTLWWAKRAGRVTAIEHDEQWYRRAILSAPPNVEVRHKTASDYVTSILDTNERFDVVVIDGGPNRNACVDPAIQSLAGDGLIVFDDTHLAYHTDGMKMLHAAGFRRIDFIGPRPGGRFIEATSMFSRSIDNWTASEGVPAFRSWFESDNKAR
jgi:hypothetical protein